MLSDSSSSLLGLATARQTSRSSAPQSSCLKSKDGDVDVLPDVSTCCKIEWWIWFLIQCILVDLFNSMSLNSGRTAQYKHNAQFLRHFGLHGDVNDAHRDGANCFKNKTK